MKNIFRTACILLVAGVMTSCASDYLDTVPTGDTSTATVLENADNAALAINGLCKMMTQQYLSSQGFNGEGTIKLYYGEYPGDEFVVNLSGWATVINQQLNDNKTSLYDYYGWYYYYKIIGNANTIIANIDAASGEQTSKDYIKAQALTFRAYCFTMLAQLYCSRWSDSNSGASQGLVLRIDQSTGDQAMSTLAETYAQIYSDLDEAIKLYTSSGISRASGNTYSPDIHVAYATYARAALCREDWATAAAMAPKARNGFPLMTVAEYKAGFCNPNQEWIWSSWGSEDETLYYYSFFSYMAYNASSSAVRSYPKRISKVIYDKIPSTDIRKGLFLDPQTYAFTASTGAAGTALTKYAFAQFPDLYSTAKVFTYMNFKFKNNAQPGVGHLNHFRSSEMYLIEAEADYHLSKTSEAQALLNELTCKSGRDASYNCTATGTALLDEIKLYRKIELWGEGFNWFDLKRWGDPVVRKSPDDGGDFLSVLAVTIQPTDANKWVWVIPERETNYNKGL
jgi:hypothetical protein